MKDESIRIHSDNLEWLSALRLDQQVISDGVFDAVAREIMTEGLPSPAEAYRIFSEISGGKAESAQFALFCRRLTEGLEGDEDNVADVPAMCTYLRGPVADKAFSHFSKEYHGLGAAYSTDFKSVCEEVYYDRADSCILPLESSADGLSPAFRHMMLKYELKIISAVRIQTGEDSYQVLALLTGGEVDPLGEMLEICLPAMSQGELSDALSVFTVFGAEVIRITSLPSRHGGKYDHHLCLEVSPAAVPSLTYTLEALYPANVLLGQYKKY